jgi:hypothetical protein
VNLVTLVPHHSVVPAAGDGFDFDLRRAQPRNVDAFTALPAPVRRPVFVHKKAILVASR